MADALSKPLFAPRTSPAAHNVERAVLSAILCNTNALQEACERLTPEDFDDPRHRALFEELYRLHAKEHKAINPEVLMDEVFHRLEEIGGIEYLKETSMFSPVPAHLDQNVARLKEKTTRRRLLTLATEISRLALEETGDIREALGVAQSRLMAISEQYATGDYQALSDVVNQLWETVNDYHENPGAMRGAPTGFPLLDYMTGGLRGGDLIILAARPSMGKTAFALNIAQHVAREKPVLLFSLEMGIHSLAMRLLCSEAFVDSHKVQQGKLNEHEWESVSATFDKLCQLQMYLDDSPSTTPFDVASKARRLKAQSGLGLVVVDYLTLLRPNTRFDSMNQQVSELSRAMKAVARELDVPVLVLSQLNRELEKTKDKRPMLSHLRESGAIEQDADLVMFLHRPDYWASASNEGEEGGEGMAPHAASPVSEAELIIAKHRNGPIGNVKLRFHRDRVRFYPADDREDRE